MRLFDILFEANIPPTKYGYWILDDGKALAVDKREGHEEMARDLLKDEYPGFSSTEGRFWTERAMWKGWARVIDLHGHPVMYIEFDEVLTPSTLSVLSRLVRDTSATGYNVNRRSFDKPIEAIKYMQNAFRPGVMS